MSQIEFLKALSASLPEAKALEASHIADYDEILPTVLMGDVARLFSESCLKTSARHTTIADTIAAHMERGYESGDEFIRDLIGLGFAENLLGEPPAVLNRLGPQVRQAVNASR